MPVSAFHAAHLPARDPQAVLVECQAARTRKQARLLRLAARLAHIGCDVAETTGGSSPRRETEATRSCQKLSRSGRAARPRTHPAARPNRGREISHAPSAVEPTRCTDRQRPRAAPYPPLRLRRIRRGAIATTTVRIDRVPTPDPSRPLTVQAPGRRLSFKSPCSERHLST